jgi:hypothetical protein
VIRAETERLREAAGMFYAAFVHATVDRPAA